MTLTTLTTKLIFWLFSFEFLNISITAQIAVNFVLTFSSPSGWIVITLVNTLVSLCQIWFTRLFCCFNLRLKNLVKDMQRISGQMLYIHLSLICWISQDAEVDKCYLQWLICWNHKTCSTPNIFSRLPVFALWILHQLTDLFTLIMLQRQLLCLSGSQRKCSGCSLDAGRISYSLEMNTHSSVLYQCRVGINLWNNVGRFARRVKV